MTEKKVNEMIEKNREKEIEKSKKSTKILTNEQENRFRSKTTRKSSNTNERRANNYSNPSNKRKSTSSNSSSSNSKKPKSTIIGGIIKQLSEKNKKPVKLRREIRPLPGQNSR